MKDYEQLTLRDHFMFGKIFQNPANSSLLLTSLLNTDINVEFAEIEKYFKEYSDGKFIRVDLISKDENGNIYDAELQHGSTNPSRKSELPKRSRLYQALIDSAAASSGIPYIDLKKIYIIFICTYDPFGQNLGMYTFHTRCSESDSIDYDDGIYKIFFNTTGNLENLPKSTQNMLKYIDTGMISDHATSYIADAVTKAREKDEWREEYMLASIYYDDVFNEGYYTAKNQLDSVIAKQASTIDSQADIIADKDNQIADKDNQIAALNNQIAELRQQFEAKNN